MGRLEELQLELDLVLSSIKREGFVVTDTFSVCKQVERPKLFAIEQYYHVVLNRDDEEPKNVYCSHLDLVSEETYMNFHALLKKQDKRFIVDLYNGVYADSDELKGFVLRVQNFSIDICRGGGDFTSRFNVFDKSTDGFLEVRVGSTEFQSFMGYIRLRRVSQEEYDAFEQVASTPICIFK